MWKGKGGASVGEETSRKRGSGSLFHHHHRVTVLADRGMLLLKAFFETQRSSRGAEGRDGSTLPSDENIIKSDGVNGSGVTAGINNSGSVITLVIQTPWHRTSILGKGSSIQIDQTYETN